MKKTITIFIMIGMTLIVVGLGFAQQKWQPHSIRSMSSNKIGEYAVELSKSRFDSYDKPAKVLVSRFISSDTIPKLGLGVDGFSSRYPVALVILQGDFDVTNNLVGIPAPPDVEQRASHILYVFDIFTGTPNMILTSVDGERFRQAVSVAPSLPTVDLSLVPDSIPEVVETDLPYPTEIPSNKVISPYPGPVNENPTPVVVPEPVDSTAEPLAKP